VTVQGFLRNSSGHFAVPFPTLLTGGVVEQRELTFVIPTYRLRDMADTVEQYDEHFWRNGHPVRIMVFDDSSEANQEKYFPLLEQTRTHNPLFYVGPREKEQFSPTSMSASTMCDSRGSSGICFDPATAATAIAR
jgi:hypothetical protein